MKNLLSVVLVAVISLSSCTNNSPGGTAMNDSLGITSEKTVGNEKSAKSTKPTEPESKWSYDSSLDKMNDKMTRYASVEAKELLQFEFPYNGGSTATFTIRKKRGSTDAYLQVSKGQFMTHVDGGSMKIKFDKAAPKTYSYSNSADGSSDIIFVNGVSDVISKIKASKTMIIEVEFYNGGNQQIEFDVAGFKPIK